MFKGLRTTIENGNGEIVADLYSGEKSLPAPPAFILGDAPPELLQFYFEQQDVWPTSCYRVNKLGVTAEGVIVDHDHIYLCNELNLHHHYVSSHYLSMSGLRDRPSRHLAVEAALLTGPGHRMYGHWLVDFLPKLFVLHICGFDIHKIKLLLPSDVPAFALDWLHYAGITDSQLLYYGVDEIVFLDSMIVPSLLRTNSRTSPLFGRAIQYLKQVIGLKSPESSSSLEKIFVARGLVTNQRPMANHEKIEEIAKHHGFRVVVPESLTIPQQVELFAAAGLIVGEYGSNLHTSIYAPPDSMICALRTNSARSMVGFLQSGLGQAMGHQTGYVFGMSNGEEAFQIDEKDFEVALRLMDIYAGGRSGRAAR